MGTIYLQEAELLLHTRRKTNIPNHMSRIKPDDGAFLLEQKHTRDFHGATPRLVGPCYTYNCHGLTFGARRSMIESSEVPMILEEDDYVEINRKQVMPGDIAVYYSTGRVLGTTAGDAEHSGIVLCKTDLGNVKIVSKWGPGDERLHFLSESPYDAGNVRFYRINDNPRSQAGKSTSG